MFVVVGATGNTGSAAADTLLSRKQPVRIVVRSADKGAAWKAKGAEIAIASLDDVSALTKAFEGAQGRLYSLPNYGAAAWLVDQRARFSCGGSREEEQRFLVFLSPDRWPYVQKELKSTNLRSQLRRTSARRSGEEPDSPPSSCYFMENWGPCQRRGQGTRCLADIHCAPGHGSNDLDQSYLISGSGAIDGRWKGQPNSRTRWAGRIQSGLVVRHARLDYSIVRDGSACAVERSRSYIQVVWIFRRSRETV